MTKLKIGVKNICTISASCTWGDGPDVVINIYRSEEHIKTWGSDFVPIDLAADEAIQLGHSLIQYGEQARELEAAGESDESR